MSSVSIHNLSVSYPAKKKQTEALHNFSLQLTEKEIYSIIGPSGSGKSTLLYVLAGIITQYKGEVLVGGEKPNPRKHSIGLVPQNYGLLPWKRVKENILLPETLGKGCASPEDFQNILKQLELEELLQRYPHELSGGQQQRVALARSFLQKPDLLLMDEPFSALDSLTAERSRKLFIDVWKKHPVTTLFVTHNLEEAVNIGNYVILLRPAPGEVACILKAPSLEEVRKQVNDLWK